MFLKKITPKKIKKGYHKVNFFIQKLYFLIFHNVKSFIKVSHRGYYSQYGQDYYLEKYIIPSLNNFKGIIIEIGCNDPIYNNNTFFFSQNHKIISIDPLDYSKEYNKRKNTTFINCAISDKKGVCEYYKVIKKEGWEDQMSGFSKPENHFKYDLVEVPTNTLNNILIENQVKKVSLLILDCEGHEYNILNLFNFDDFNPDVVVIENKMFGSKIRRLMNENNYSLKYRFWTADDVYIRKE